METSPLFWALVCGLGAALFAAADLIANGTTGLMRILLLRHKVMDIPNERSSHTIPTPRGGGLAVSGVIVAGLVLVYFFAPFFFPQPPDIADERLRLYAPLVCSALLLMGVSWADDRFNVRPQIRLGVHLLAAAIGCLALPQDAEVFGDLLPYWLDRLIVIVGWAWFMNLYNFMDGIDGITGVESLSLALGAVAVFLAIEGQMPDDYQDMIVRNGALAALIGGASLGFLAWNWHPAKIFLGDVGSVPLGFFTGFLLLHLATDGALAAAIILPLYYLIDSGLTLVRRALRGEKIWQAHREHFYQKAAMGIGDPRVVVKWIGRTNLGLIILALLATSAPWAALIIAVLVVSGLLSVMSKASMKS